MAGKSKAVIMMGIKPYYNRHRRTVLRVGESSTEVTFIPLDVAEGLKLDRLSLKEFAATYKEIPNYPSQKAVEVFVAYAKDLGATKEVMEVLKTVVDISDDHMHKALTRRPEEEVKPKVKLEKGIKIIKEAPKSIKISSAKKVEPAVVKELKVVKKPVVDGEYKSAAAMFQGLIMEAKLTDLEIFEAVKEKFGVGDDKKGYVKWYRYNLTRKGKNPPAEVVK